MQLHKETVLGIFIFRNIIMFIPTDLLKLVQHRLNKSTSEISKKVTE